MEKRLVVRKVGPTSWVAYEGSQAVWETASRGAMTRWLRKNGYTNVVNEVFIICKVV